MTAIGRVVIYLRGRRRPGSWRQISLMVAGKPHRPPPTPLSIDRQAPGIAHCRPKVRYGWKANLRSFG